MIADAGPIGLLSTQVALAFGAAEVIVADTSPHRRQVASRYGATAIINPTQEDIASLDLDVDAFIDASGAQAASRAGFSALRPARRAVLVGMGADDMSLPVSRIQSREIEVEGVFRYANTWPLAIQLASSDRVDLDSLVTSTFDLDHTEDALRSASSPETLKAVVRPNMS